MSDIDDLDIRIAPLRTKIIQQFSLGTHSIHGPAHWARVEKFGLMLAAKNGADVEIVRLFSLFHDSCRKNESHDPGHGMRGAQLADAWRGIEFELEDMRFKKLHFACSYHTDGELSVDLDIGTCWDADRLDLPRVGLIPNPKQLSTTAAKCPEMISWALTVSRPLGY